MEIFNCPLLCPSFQPSKRKFVTKKVIMKKERRGLILSYVLNKVIMTK